MARKEPQRAQVLVVGGGLGGVAAALAAVRRGCSVILTEESSWLGGALTSQAAPPDEHRWIERAGATDSYRRLRDAIRAIYRRYYPLSQHARRSRYLNPGGGWVGPLCAEPVVARLAIECLLAPYRAGGLLSICTGYRPIAADIGADVVRGLEFSASDDSTVDLAGDIVIDATEEGAVLPLAGVEYVTGSESERETGEPHAAPERRAANMQAITHAFAVDHRPGENHTIDRPHDYERWRTATLPGWPGPLLGWRFPDPRTLRPVTLPFTPNPLPELDSFAAHSGDRPSDRDLWRYRRIVARHQLAPDTCASDATVINWPMNDYAVGPIIDVDSQTRATRLTEARQLSCSLLYWLQTEAPRPDGGLGWPGLRMRGDLLGTSDGYALRPYIRESRRIRAEVTVREQDVSSSVRGRHGSVRYDDSVGVGSYRIDLHPTTEGDTYLDIGTLPFEIPLGALIPTRVDNVLAGAKNIGTTHISSGCYRVHPVEWNVGEVAGALAATSAQGHTTPRSIRGDPGRLRGFQAELMRDGVQIRWPDVRS